MESLLWDERLAAGDSPAMWLTTNGIPCRMLFVAAILKHIGGMDTTLLITGGTEPVSVFQYGSTEFRRCDEISARTIAVTNGAGVVGTIPGAWSHIHDKPGRC